MQLCHQIWDLVDRWNARLSDRRRISTVAQGYYARGALYDIVCKQSGTIKETAQILLPMVLVLQLPLCGTRSHSAFATLPLPIPSVAFLKLTASSRLLAHPSSSPKRCLRFGHWLTLCTLKIVLLTYLLYVLLNASESAPLIRSRPWHYMNLFIYLLTWYY